MEAYGEIDGYGVSLHVSVSQAARLWDHPTSPADISNMFIRHVNGELEAIPWTEEGLNDESITIREELLKLNRRGWWTVASQPAANGVKSDDKVFGWGPKNGFVFQKASFTIRSNGMSAEMEKQAFVEFFLPTSDWEKLRRKLSSLEDVSYYAGNADGDFMCSDSESVNAVTWGVFPGKEYVLFRFSPRRPY